MTEKKAIEVLEENKRALESYLTLLIRLKEKLEMLNALS